MENSENQLSPWESPARMPELEPITEPQLARARPPLVHLLLFLATVVTTITAGAMQQGVNPWEHPGQLYKGLPFSLTLLTILFCHEMGHYLAARYHDLDVSLPYFLPAPPIPFIIGTFGAFIRIRSPILHKPALLDVGAAGPLIGVLVTLPLLVIGLQLSDLQPAPPAPEAMPGIALGESLLFKFVCWLTLGDLPADHNLIMHPMAFAGWIGLLVTNINLFPIGQLDGGHVSYALFGDQSQRLGLIFYLFLIACGLLAWYGWLVWALLLYFLGTKHPAPLLAWVPLDPRRRRLGFLTVAVFILTFIPAPFQV